MWVAFAVQKILTFFFSAKNINVFAIFQDKNFNTMLANNFVKFEQLNQGSVNYQQFDGGGSGMLFGLCVVLCLLVVVVSSDFPIR